MKWMGVPKRKKELLNAHRPARPIATDYGRSLRCCATKWDSRHEIEQRLSVPMVNLSACVHFRILSLQETCIHV